MQRSLVHMGEELDTPSWRDQVSLLERRLAVHKVDAFIANSLLSSASLNHNHANPSLAVHDWSVKMPHTKSWRNFGSFGSRLFAEESCLHG